MISFTKNKKYKLQEKSINITENGSQTIIPDSGYYGFKNIHIETDTPSGTDTSDATATANDILYNKTAYVNGQKLEGNIQTPTGLSTYYPIGYNTVNTHTESAYNENNWILVDPLDVIRNEGNSMHNYITTDNNTKWKHLIGYKAIANAIGLTPNVIKKDANVLDIIGTYEGSGSGDTYNVEINTAFTSAKNTIIKNITKIDSIDLSNLTSVQGMFENFISLVEIKSMNTTNITSMRNMFLNCSSLTTLPSQFNTSSVADVYQMFSGCSNLVSVPQLDTSNCQFFGFMFAGCRNLKNIPMLSLAKATDISFMFYNCTSLTNDDLNKIMSMCININPSYSGAKTLKQMNLSQAQTTTCQSLSNWSAFTAAGWTTGY